MVYFGTGYVWLIMVVINNWRPQCLALLIGLALLPGRGPWKSEIRIRIPQTRPLTKFFAAARDNLDVDVLRDGGEGDLEAADGGGVGAPRLHVGQPGTLPSTKVSQNF